ncbi:hypothetical protein S83_010767 [Arachis hypogaea]
MSDGCYLAMSDSLIRGCPNLQKLEMRGCSFFSERALAIAANRLLLGTCGCKAMVPLLLDAIFWLWLAPFGISS